MQPKTNQALMIAGMFARTLFTVGLTAVTIAMPSAHARGVSPYLPLKLAPEIERDIERVLILGDKPILARPLAAATVLDALPKACQRDTQLCRRVQRYLQRYMRTLGVTHASIEGSSANDAAHAVPNRHGLTSDSAWAASVSGFVQPSDYLLVSAGAVGDENDMTPTGSMLSLGFEYAQLDIGYRDHWYSPMTDSAMLLSTNAPTLPSITLSNYTPISAFGVQYELFLAQMETSERIAYEGRYTVGEPRLAGIRLGIEPGGGWALSANRVIQFGGGERGGRGAGDFFDALFKPHDYDNTSATLSSDQEFGNQTAAWTSRMLIPGRVPFAVYFEYAGEDASYSGNYRLGNAALSAGIDFPMLWNGLDLTYEFSEWQNGWYVHGVYQDGLINKGRSIGHWFGDARLLHDSVGGQSHMLRVGWQARYGGQAEVRYRTIDNETYTGTDYSRAQELSLRYSHPWRSVLLGGEATAGRDVFGENYSRLAAFARFGAEYGGLGGYADNERETDSSVEYFVDAGGSANRLRIEIADGRPVELTDISYAPHIGVGARRAVSDNSDLGVRLELDRIDDELLVSVRALDYRYRLNRHAALTFFGGAARYNLATPAFGYYFGAGVQWRDVLPKLDLSLDVRNGNKVARDKVLASDPAPTPRPDMFYDLIGATLYFSYRW
jgi:hypothetical protein